MYNNSKYLKLLVKSENVQDPFLFRKGPFFSSHNNNFAEGLTKRESAADVYNEGSHIHRESMNVQRWSV